MKPNQMCIHLSSVEEKPCINSLDFGFVEPVLRGEE